MYSGPCLVHCHDGAGRSGVYVIMDANIRCHIMFHCQFLLKRPYCSLAALVLNILLFTKIL
jgi:hypothetical protein